MALPLLPFFVHGYNADEMRMDTLFTQKYTFRMYSLS